MRIPSGKTDQVIYFVAVDSTDLKTRETGLSSFTVYRSRNGGAATAYTTPTVAELSAANMPGVYALTIDEDTTIASTSDSEEYVVHITQASMAPVTRTIELYRRDTTSGQTLTVANGAADADIERIQGTVIATPATAGVLDVNMKNIANAAVSTSTAQLGVNVVNAGGTAWGSGAITAASIASNAITSAKIATDAIGAAQIADNAIDAGAIAADAITAAKIANGAIDAATFASNALDAVWSTAARTLTALDEDSTTIDLDATIAAAVPSAATIAGAVWDLTTTGHDLTNTFGELLPFISGNASSAAGSASSANSNILLVKGTVDTLVDDIPPAVWGHQVDSNTTAEESMRLQNSALGAKASGLATTTATFRDLEDTKNRIVATVDADGNRTAVTLDLS